MVRLRQARVDDIAADIPGTILDEDDDAELLVIGWGSTWGAITAGVRRVRRQGRRISQAHLVHVNPLPADLGDIIARYPKVLCPELNLGQMTGILRDRYLADVRSFTKVSGLPFGAQEMEARMIAELDR